MKNRVVITGLGVLAPNGVGVEQFWRTLLARESGVGYITLFDAKSFPCRIAGEIKGFDPSHHISGVAKAGRMARHTQLAIAAAQMALRDAGFDSNGHSPGQDVPIYLGISSSAFELIERGMTAMLRRGVDGVSPSVVRSSPPQAAATAMCQALKFSTQSTTISTACASGLDAVAAAAAAIRAGCTDLAVARGSDAPVTPLAFSTFWTAGLVSARNEQPLKASRPFDAFADSGVISEGAGIVVVENMDHALARGARPYAEITGYGTFMDTADDQPGSGLSDSMTGALANAGRMAEDVDYVSAHGPGHPLLDRIETAAIKKSLGPHAYSIPVSSIKGCTGNPLSAGGVHQIAACAMAIMEQMIPPTANCEEPDAECDLDYVTEGPRRARVSCVLVNSHGIGGGNSSMVMERIPE